MVYIQAGTDRVTNKDFTSLANGGLFTHTRHSHLKGNGSDTWIMRETDTCRRLARINQVQLGPDSLPPQGLQSADVFFDIRITGAGVHSFDRATLHLTVQNTLPTGTVGGLCYPMLPFYFFNRIEIMSDGSFTDDTIYPHQLYVDYIHTIGGPEKVNRSIAVGMNCSSYADNLTQQEQFTYDEDQLGIPAGGSREYFIPLYTFLTTTSLFLPGKTQDPRYRFYLAANPYCTYNAAAVVPGTLLLAGAEMIITGEVYSDEVLLTMARHYKGNLSVSRCLLHERQLITQQGFLPGTDLGDLSLTSLNGEYSIIWVFVLRNDALKQQLYQSNVFPGATFAADDIGWVPMYRLGIVDSSGNPVGYNKESVGYLKYDLAGNLFPETAFYQYKNICPFFLCTDPGTTLSTGQSTGGLMFDSNFVLQLVSGDFTPGTTTSYTVYVDARRYGLLQRSRGGTFKVTKL